VKPTTEHPSDGDRAAPSARRRLPGILGGLLLLQAVLVAAFVLPAHKPEPHGVPVGVIGPPAAAEALEAGEPGALDARRFSSEAAAREAIEEREVYGALVVDGSGRRMLVASAASASIAQMLRGAADHAGQVTIEDVTPLAGGDPRGATLNLMFLPLVVVCIPAVVLLASLGLSAPKLIGAISLFAGLGGLTVVALVGKGLDTLPGSYLALSGIAALTMLAVALPTAGLYRLLGHAGIALAALLFVLIGNPASGNGSAPELLPWFWRTIGQFMPSGAGGTGLRNTAYFDGNALFRPLLVLGIYAAIGAALVLAAEAVRRRRARPADAPVPASDAPAFARS
jgi:hypothetical protein